MDTLLRLLLHAGVEADLPCVEGEPPPELLPPLRLPPGGPGAPLVFAAATDGPGAARDDEPLLATGGYRDNPRPPPMLEADPRDEPPIGPPGC